jgi:uroporphyrinogen-III synthase
MALQWRQTNAIPSRFLKGHTGAMKIIVTRPSEDAARFADRLRRAGASPVLSPVMSIAYLDVDPPEGMAALAFTSANGVRAFARRSAERSAPAFVVGEATAAEARAAGFADVRTAGGDVAALAETIAAASPAAVLHVAGTHRAGDLVALLGEKNIAAQRATLYEARPIEAMTDEARAAFAAGAGVAFFSPRSVELFERQVRAAGFEPPFAATAYCYSPAVAEAANAFARRVVATAADADSLCARIVEDAKIETAATVTTAPARRPYGLIAAALIAAVLAGFLLTRRQPTPSTEPAEAAPEEVRLELPAEAAAEKATAAEKILNAPVAEEVPSLKTLDPESFPDAPVNQLPPPPTHTDNANAGLQQAAKAAADLFKDGGASGDYVIEDDNAPDATEEQTRSDGADKIRSLHATGLKNSILAQNGAEATRSARRALLLVDIQKRIAAGAPFADALGAYREWGGAEPGALVAETAVAGAATEATLKEQFAPARDEALALGRRAEADGAIGRVGASVASTFGVRPAEPIEGGSTAAVLSRAEAAVDKGDFRAAVTELDGLRPPASAAFEDWRARALARLAVDQWVEEQRATISNALDDAP